jgi:hypothetical protein
MRTAAAELALLAGVCAASAIAAVAAGNALTPARAVEVLPPRPCPPLGTTVGGRVIVAEDDLAGNTAVPLGRRFVVIRCKRASHAPTEPRHS